MSRQLIYPGGNNGSMNIIAADVGGTKTRLIWTNTDQTQNILFECQYNSNNYSGIVALLDAFISESDLSRDELDVLALALPGVIDSDNVELTNLPWSVSKEALKSEYQVDHVIFVNDFQASSRGVMLLDSSDLIVLNPADELQGGLKVTVGAGTGLGLSWMHNGTVFATEGGHIDFAPTSHKQLELLEFMMHKKQHVSYERLLSGAGLVTLYEFCSGENASHHDASWVTSQCENYNSSAIEAVSLFVAIYGAYVGNLALLFRPTDGIYITGGIAPKIIKWLKTSMFMDAFLNKGRMKPLAEKTGVYVVTDQRVGALGAVSLALENLQDCGHDYQ